MGKADYVIHDYTAPMPWLWVTSPRGPYIKSQQHWQDQVPWYDPPASSSITTQPFSPSHGWQCIIGHALVHINAEIQKQGYAVVL